MFAQDEKGAFWSRSRTFDRRSGGLRPETASSMSARDYLPSKNPLRRLAAYNALVLGLAGGVLHRRQPGDHRGRRHARRLQAITFALPGVRAASSAYVVPAGVNSRSGTAALLSACPNFRLSRRRQTGILAMHSKVQRSNAMNSRLEPRNPNLSLGREKAPVLLPLRPWGSGPESAVFSCSLPSLNSQASTLNSPLRAGERDQG